MTPQDHTREANEAVEHAAMGQVLPPDLYSGFLAISADAVIAVDDEQHIIFFNEGAERIFGYSASEVGGKYLAMLLPERYRATHRGHVHGFGAAHGRARLMGERQEISGLRKSGEEFPAEASIQRMEIGGKDIYAAVLRDVSARYRAEEALHQAIRARDDMMGIVSHDLRNPASAVKMLARSILAESRDRGDIPADVTERVEIMQQAAAQIDALIQDLLDVTRLEAGRLTVLPRDVDPVPLVEAALHAMRALAESSGVELKATYGESLPMVHADPDRVTQLLSNLVGNALKFTPAGGRVEVHVQAHDEAALVSVIDNGEGIPAEQLPHVFDRFFQVSSSRIGSRHGAGLGLPIARGIVEAHGGTIWIESAPGHGTTVRFTLPEARGD
ncbi:MAG TPA: PAS domain-containing sensor histidine kinase [Gemmatimonadaceae bacterium]|nr:PAS domain-containing sensor histidine kinase [Gemmatimonadaceae bacterium]